MRLLKIMIFAALSIPVPILAGYKDYSPVFVGEGYAYGSVSNAYASTSVSEHIGCANNNEGFVQCSAQGSDPTRHAYCSSNKAVFQGVALSVRKSSYVYFEWDASGECTEIYVRNGSLYLP